MRSKISPSDLVHGVIVAHVVFSSRDKLEHQWNPVMALCYLAEAIGIPQSRQYSSFSALSQSFDRVVGVKNGLDDVWQSMLRISIVDDFSLLIESMRNAIIPNASIDFNGLTGPSLVTPDSNIGIFIRSLLVQWECFLFGDLCELFEQMEIFLGKPVAQQIPNKQMELSSAFSDVFNTSYRLIPKNTDDDALNDTELLRTAAIASLELGDVAEAERALHRLFDQNGTDPLRCGMNPMAEVKTPDSLEVSNDTGVARTLEEMLHSDESALTSCAKHQHAMLSLASMWLRTDNYPMALSAVEEALKTAHQRGDHAAVAQSLFLLHSVFQGSGDPNLVTSVEDILVRCTKRSAALDLQHLTSQSALILAQLRSKQPFRDGSLLVGDEPNSSDPAAETANWRVEDIWTQISFSLLGEIALTRQVITPLGITEDAEFTQSGPAHAMAGPLASSNSKKENLQDAPLPVCAELVRLSLQASLVASDLWMRMGMLDMSEFACLRAVKQFAAVASAEDMSVVYLKLIHVQVRILQQLSNSAPRSYLPVKALVKQIRSSLPGTVPPATAQQLDRAEVLVATQAARADGDWSKAFRLAHRLVDLSGASSSDADVDALVLLAESMAPFDVQTSQQLLEEIHVSCKRDGNLVTGCLCMFLKAKYALEHASEGDADVQSAIRSIERSLSFARKNGVGLVDAYFGQFSADFNK